MGLMLISGCNDEKSDSAKKDESMMEALSGKWSGSIMVPNQPLDIIVNLNKSDEWSGNISIPVQGVNDYPLSSVTVNNKNISFFMEIQGQQISFDGNVNNNKIEGDFSQHGQTFPFELTKSDEGDKTADTTGEFLSVQTDKGTLYGELEEPSGDAPFPVMIIIPGSGPTDRNGNSPAIQGKNNSLKLLAEQLAEHGIASVRYDKRGVGKNVEAAIPEKELDFNQFVYDAKAWVEQLAQEEAYTKVGIIGHSQGSLVGMLAVQDSNTDTFISIAGPGHSIDQVLYDQLKEQLSGELLQESDEILKKVKQGKQVEDVSQELMSVFRPSVQGFMSSWMQYNPSEEIAKLEIPTLIVNGDNDIQVPVTEAQLLKDANRNSELLVVEKMNHVLKEAPQDSQGNMEAYSNPELPLASGLMEGIVGFLKEGDFLK